FAEFPFRLEPSGGPIGSPVGGQCPHNFLFLIPVGGNHNSEEESLTSRVEMLRLPAITARSYRVIGADRNIQFLFIVPVQISEDHAPGSVGIVFPSLEYGSHILSRGVVHLRVDGNTSCTYKNGGERHVRPEHLGAPTATSRQPSSPCVLPPAVC